MPDFSVTGIVTIDNTQSLLEVDEVMTAADKATARLVMLRRKALSTLSLAMGIINQGYAALKQMISITGGIMEPMFDMLFTIISSIAGVVLAGAIMMMASGNPILMGAAIIIAMLGAMFSVKATMDLHERQGTVENFMNDMKMSIARSSHIDPFQPSSGSGF